MAEVTRPDPEVEFSRVADTVRPEPNYQGAGSASLIALRANQQGPGFSPRPPVRMGSINGATDRTATRKDSASSSGHAERSETSVVTAAVGTDAGARSMAGASIGSKGVGTGNAGNTGAPVYFNDEWDVPFRANAVEIAAQDDKNECAFLSHELGTQGNEMERARSILPQLVGQLHPATTFGASGLPLHSERLRKMRREASSSGKLHDELAVIDDFNNRARQRVQEIGSESVLTQFACQHLAVVIRQLLDEIEVSEDAGWDQVVFDLAMNAVQRVRPSVKAGDNMDLRRYVRIKRIPGGTPADSQYVTGIVFTKNLAHRRMPQYLDSPQIMLLTMTLEVSAPSKYTSFDDELRVQQGFTEKLVQRIADAAPDLVLAEKTVPRRVLEGLMRHRIAVAYGVKRSVIRAVARCTGADIVTSMDRFSDYPKTGTCSSLAVQTYEHESLAGYRKSFIFLDGCIEELGGTIVLRGESFAKLGEIKQVVDLVVCLAYSMYLEGALLVNEFVLAAPGNYDGAWNDPSSTPVAAAAASQDADNQSLALQALSEYNIALSSSSCVRIPPPHVLVCMRERELAIRAVTERFNKMSNVFRDLNPITGGNGSSSSNDGVSGTFGVSGVAFLVSRQQQSAASLSRMRQQYESEVALHESYIHAGKMFLEANPQAVSMWDYQSIVVTYMVTCRKHEYMLCLGPQYHPIAFYSFTDVTLGQYLEEICFDLRYNCPSGNRRCTHPMYEHQRSYIHNHGRIDVTVDEHPCPIERLSEVILMWSECKRCKKHSPVTRMSDASWRYSFGKYLETTFYNAPLLPRALLCPHDMHRDHVRCFALRNMIVRFEYSSFAIWSIATPTTPLYFNMDVSIRLKEQEAAELRTRMDAYYTSLLSRLDAFPRDLVYSHKAEECRHVLQDLAARAATEQVYFQQTLEQTMRNTHPADTLVVVVVYEALQAKVVEWNLQFSELAQTFIQLDATNRAANLKRTSTADGAVVTIEPAHLKEHEIDSLQIIDELHTAAHHHNMMPAADIPAVATSFAMPRLSSSPSSENFADTMASLSRSSSIEEREYPRMSRLHRRLSMEAMRKERIRQERAQEKQRRNAEALEARGKHARAGGVGGLKTIAQQHQTQQPQQQPKQEQPPQQQQHQYQQLHAPKQPAQLNKMATDQAALTGAAAGKNIGRAYSTTRLIGGVATDVDEDVRLPRQTEFPELRGRRGKSKMKYAAEYGSKITQPLFDLLHRALPPQSPGVPPAEAEPLDEADIDIGQTGAQAPPPSRIPGIRTLPQSSVQTQSQSQSQSQQGRDGAEGDITAVAAASNRPLSSFGRPPDTRNSNIPRPPNIRGIATAPPSTALAPTSDAGITAGDDGGARSSSNVFLRLAKRLNNARGQHTNASSGAILGTVPRKMNLLLPAAAQYMSQHPHRPAMSQVQVFYTKPVSDESNRKSAPTRRHSYQPTADQLNAVDPEALPASSATSAARTHFSRAAVPGSSNPRSSHYELSHSHNSSQQQRSLRLRSSTVSQMISKDSKRYDSDNESRRNQPYDYSPQPAHSLESTVTRAAEEAVTVAAPLEAVVPHTTPPERKPSVTLRASNIIPTITRRLGLGFGFKTALHSASNASKNTADHEPGMTTDEDEGPSPSAVREAHRSRRPIPPHLVISRNSMLGSGDGSHSDASTDRRSRRRSGTMARYVKPRSSSSSESSDSSSSDSETSSDSDIDSPNGSVDDQLPEYTGNMLRTPVDPVLRPSPTSHHVNSIGSTAAQMDLFVSSPLRTATHSSAMTSRNRHKQSGSWATDSEDGSAFDHVHNPLDSSNQPYLRIPLRRDSSTEDDEPDAHEPDLHFGQSDAGSDVENAGNASDQEARTAAAYLQSVIDSSNANFSADRSTLASKSPVGQSLGKIALLESGMETAIGGTVTGGSGRMSASGDSSAAITMPQENMSTLWKTISNLLMAPGNSQLFQLGLDLTYPLDSTEHVIAGSPIIVRENEPSSIIAFTLMASEYRQALHVMFEEAKADVEADGENLNAAASPRSRRNSDASHAEDGKLGSPVNEFIQAESPPNAATAEDAVIERIMLHSQGLHLRFEFTAGQTEFVCRVFYAAQFEALRRCNNCEDSYIESLSRCMTYIAKGGKSGSAFLRTRDERFIIKEVSKAESDAFLRFAPFYFEHMYTTYRDVMLTVLAKIFGFCRVSYRKASTGKWVKMSVVIMENLFYERKCSRVFDLKGSERNRMVEETGINAVFQDENLIKLIRQNPICIRQQTKSHLHDAIWNDTLFLSKMNVMDYSLLVGFDENSKELVVGIVDFIRTFTWDKKLESWVKEAGILGGGGKGPTIVSPKQYKTRFREAMERYFLMVPDKYFAMQPGDEI
ncbi:Mitochondrial distribution and morphology protein 12 [Kickxella alabastrina]|uniref:Mitochondrial distribution and morphology protein 12 n=1 Tax=Kickxella alabastrina TaxID=61397 RepID=A0ACC1IUK3_9FUNG|nr:Mitochondrial distribution and morphology protein 12 [Kickxella alabastrina]